MEEEHSFPVGTPRTRYGVHPCRLRHGENASRPTDPESRLRALLRWTSRDTVPTLWSPRENRTWRNEEPELRSGAEWLSRRFRFPYSENRPGRRAARPCRLDRSEIHITRRRFNLDFPHSATRVVSTYHVDGCGISHDPLSPRAGCAARLFSPLHLICWALGPRGRGRTAAFDDLLVRLRRSLGTATVLQPRIESYGERKLWHGMAKGKSVLHARLRLERRSSGSGSGTRNPP